MWAETSWRTVDIGVYRGGEISERESWAGLRSLFPRYSDWPVPIHLVAF